MVRAMRGVTGPGCVVAGRYQLLDRIGQGSMGTVWRARDLVLTRDVAIKEVGLPGVMSDRDLAVLRGRTLREARVSARLTHPGVITIYDVIESAGIPWIVMELIAARSLEQILARDGPLPPRRAAATGMMLLGALASAHALGIVHRDVKPGNVLLAGDGRAVMTDFGIAAVDGDPGLTQTGMVMGTPGFCAPERIRGEPASPASDLWSLGATLYAAVEGRGPFEGQGSAMAVLANIVHGDPPTATRAGPLEPVILALMRRDPAARPNATAARRLLTAACSGYSAKASASAQTGDGTRADNPARAGDGTRADNPARADDGARGEGGGKDASADGGLAEPGSRSGTRAPGGTLPLPTTLPQDDAALA